MDAAAARRDLLERFEGHQARLEGYLQTERPRNSRLAGLAIAGSSVSAALTAGPAIGGPSFTAATASVLDLSDTSYVWRIFCLGALILSIVAAVAVNLSNNLALNTRVAAAENASAELEGLHSLLTFGEIGVGEAVRAMHATMSKVGFVAGPSRQ